MALKPSNNKEQLSINIARAVGAGKSVEVEVVDFNDPNRPKTCLEIDFPIVLVGEENVNGQSRHFLRKNFLRKLVASKSFIGFID